VDATAIHNLVVRYSLAIDDGRLDEVAAMFSADATFAARYGEPLRGREAIVEFLSANAAGQEASAHVVEGHLIEPDGEDRAVGIVQVAAVLDKGGETLRLALRCHDRYRRLDGRWLFAHRGIVVRYRDDAEGGEWSLAGAIAAAAEPALDEQTRYVLERIWPS
jgi:uncharacterized protein (TIGR02246 family)